jgi:hypothetical protein
MKRILEPELMIGDDQCKEFNQVSHRQYADGKFLESYKKYCNLVSGTLIDLGSGPAVHLDVLSTQFPNLNIVGYENSDAMLVLAKQNTNVEVRKADFNTVRDTADGVMCLYTLHHQSDPLIFWKTVSRISNGYVYVEDFERPDSEEMFEYFNAIDDFKHSLRASFTLNEVKEHLKILNLDYTVIKEPIDLDKKLYKLIIYQKT